MQRLPRLAVLFPACSADFQIPAISQVNEYQFLANTITIIPSNYSRLGRSYTYYTTTQPLTT
jgi:hypothetical protein